jgi:hypothetical protein
VWASADTAGSASHSTPVPDRQAPVQTLWLGRITVMERLSIASYAANGHEVHLYAYDDLGALPSGAVLKDADDVLRARSIFRDSRGSFAGFADMFRYKLLLELGGWWVDLDTVCLQPFDLTEDYVFATEPDLTVATAIFRVPPGSEVMTYAYERCVGMRRKRRKWGMIGPRLLAEAVEACGLANRAVHYSVFMPLDWPDWEQLLDPDRVWHFDSHTRALHLWNAMWALGGRDKEASYPPACLYEILKRR